ncbi:MAG: hypothetical protein JXR78_01800 [Victivallales bacterium]|nr:hypothetical protein [Victivallales bacterium]
MMQNQRKAQVVKYAPEWGDRPQPHSLEVERAVLAAMLREDECVSMVLNSGVTVDAFYSVIYAEVFKAIESLRKSNRTADMLTVCDALKLKGELDNIGGEMAIADIYSSIATTANIAEWVASLLEFHARRLLLKSCIETSGRCFHDDTPTAEIYADLQAEIRENERYALGKADKPTGEKLKEFFGYISELQTGAGGIVVPWGIRGLDGLIKVQRKQMFVLGGGSNSGKTRFILNDAIGKLEKNIGVAIFSHENSSETLFAGLISILTDIPMDTMQRQGGLNEVALRKIQKAAEWLRDKKELLHIFGKGEYVHSPRGISLKVRAIQERTGGILGAVEVDYIQNMTCDNKYIRGRVEQLDDIILNLSNISGDFNIFLLVLSQLNRDKLRDAANKRPEIADIKGSSTIEQEADVIAFIHNPDKRAIGDIQLGFYTRKVRGPNPFEDRLNFCTFTGKINGIASRYGDEDNPGNFSSTKHTKGHKRVNH